MSLVMPDGRPYTPGAFRESGCPQCGAPASDHTRLDGFGGHWEVVCLKCGHLVSSSRGNAPAKV